MKRERVKKFMKISSIMILFIIVISIAAQAVILVDINLKETSFAILEPNVSLNGGSSFMWEDEFLDESKIDVEKSYNYIVDKSEGRVIMENTYEAWYNPDWTRMKNIDINNQGSTTFNEYVLDVVVYYDSDMRSDFQDLRFTDNEGNDLYYWVGEMIEGESANVLVRVPEIPPGHSYIYMFYGDPTAEDESNFDMIFTWDDRTDPDIMISYKNYLEGAWDPDVEFGNGRFLVAWEERLGPEDLPLDMERIIPCCIHGRTYNSDGGDPNPSGDADIDISPSDDYSYHAENPSIAYGGGVFFVVWEENPADQIINRYEADIKAALVTPEGQVTKRFTICNAPNLQCDPHVTYDSSSQRFFTVWEDARDSSSNYDVYGRIYDENGNPLGSDFQVAAGANCQDEPWICSDNQGYFMVVYEDGYNPETGPFSLFSQKFDSNGNKVGSTRPIASGTDRNDNIFPSISFCTQNERYFVSWNDADLSMGYWRGNIWGKILDKYGNVVFDNFIVQPGYQYVRSDVVPYLETLFFISYDGSSDLWGTLVSSDGKVQTEEHMLSDGSSQSVDWNNLAVGDGRIFATWEDERDQTSEYADAFGSVWQVYRSTDSPHVSYNFGEEKEIITQAVVVSTLIPIDNGFLEWEEFNALYLIPVGGIQFDILNEQATQVLLGNINPGKDISSLPDEPIRIRATFTRTIPKNTPILDSWSVSWLGSDHDPPWTQYEMNPSSPDGDNNWYTVSVEFTLNAHDDVSPTEDIITYFKINDGQQNIYDTSNKPKISTDYYNNTIEFWSVDAAQNEETPHNLIHDIKIDRTKPTVTIEKPEWGKILPGNTQVKVVVYESGFGSGIDKVEIWFNGGKVAEFQEQYSYSWSFTAEKWQQYEIEAKAYDKAGNVGNSYVSVRCPRFKSFTIFQLYFLEKLLERFPILALIF